MLTSYWGKTDNSDAKRMNTTPLEVSLTVCIADKIGKTISLTNQPFTKSKKNPKPACLVWEPKPYCLWLLLPLAVLQNLIQLNSLHGICCYAVLTTILAVHKWFDRRNCVKIPTRAVAPEHLSLGHPVDLSCCQHWAISVIQWPSRTVTWSYHRSDKTLLFSMFKNFYAW